MVTIRVWPGQDLLAKPVCVLSWGETNLYKMSDNKQTMYFGEFKPLTHARSHVCERHPQSLAAVV